MRDVINIISAGRLWSEVLTVFILVELALVFAIFHNQTSWLVIVHHAYVVATLSWLMYARYTIKALGRRV